MSRVRGSNEREEGSRQTPSTKPTHTPEELAHDDRVAGLVGRRVGGRDGLAERLEDEREERGLHLGGERVPEVSEVG